MASQEQREAAIRHAVEMVNGGCIWLRPALDSPTPPRTQLSSEEETT